MRRWPFRAGLAGLPLLVCLALAGATGPFRADIEAWLDRPYDELPAGRPRSPASAEVRAALLAVPGAAFRHYQLPATATGAAQVLVARGRTLYRVYVEPATLRPMQVVEEDLRPLNRLVRLLAPGAAEAAAQEPGFPGLADVCTAEPEAYLHALDAAVPLAMRLQLPRPVWISPPALPDGAWTVSSPTQDPQLRLRYTADAGHTVLAGTP